MGGAGVGESILRKRRSFQAAGTIIALYFSVSNLGMVLGIAAGWFLTIWMIYLIMAIVCGLRLLPLSRIKMREVEKTFYQQEGE